MVRVDYEGDEVDVVGWRAGGGGEEGRRVEHAPHTRFSHAPCFTYLLTYLPTHLLTYLLTYYLRPPLFSLAAHLGHRVLFAVPIREDTWKKMGEGGGEGERRDEGDAA